MESEPCVRSPFVALWISSVSPSKEPMHLRFLRRSLTAMMALAATSVLAEDARSPFPPPVSPDKFERHGVEVAPPEMIAPGRYRMGEIELNKAEKSVTFPATLNMNKGLLEYLLVRTGGKTHESLLRTDVEPYNLQLALLLVGMEGTNAPLSFQGDPATPRGEGVEIVLRLKADSGKEFSPEAWLLQLVGEDPRNSPPLNWIYTGSVVRNGRFAAQIGGSIVALYHDPVAMVDNASPGGESNRIWFAKEDSAPPVGTPVLVTIRSKKSDPPSVVLRN